MRNVVARNHLDKSTGGTRVEHRRPNDAGITAVHYVATEEMARRGVPRLAAVDSQRAVRRSRRSKENQLRGGT